MPLTAKGEKIMGAMQEQYGSEKGEKVFYASKNAGRITGVDCDPRADMAPGKFEELSRLFDEFLEEEKAEREHRGDASAKENEIAYLERQLKTATGAKKAELEKALKEARARPDSASVPAFLAGYADSQTVSGMIDSVVHKLRGKGYVHDDEYRDDVTLPTNMKADWKAEKINGRWYACGTTTFAASGSSEYMQIKRSSEDDARRYAERQNRNIQEVNEENRRANAERDRQAKEIRARRAAEQSKQGRLFG